MDKPEWMLDNTDLVELFCMDCDESHDCKADGEPCGAFLMATQIAKEASLKLLRCLIAETKGIYPIEVQDLVTMRNRLLEMKV